MIKSTWNDVKYNMMEIQVQGFIGRTWSAFRLIFTGRIPTGSTWAQIDEHIQSYKAQSNSREVRPLSLEDINEATQGQTTDSRAKV